MKKLFLNTLALACVVSFAACSQSKSTTTASTAPEAPASAASATATMAPAKTASATAPADKATLRELKEVKAEPGTNVETYQISNK